MRPVNVELVPVPVEVTVPGYRIKVQLPDEGNPVNNTLPVATVHFGAVIVPTTGAVGIVGCAIIKTLPVGNDIHPIELVTVIVNMPDGSVETVAAAPEPEISTPPGLLVNIQVPVAGSPLKTTLPVDIAQVGWVIVPTTGADGADGAGFTTASAETEDIHPSALVTLKL